MFLTVAGYPFPEIIGSGPNDWDEPCLSFSYQGRSQESADLRIYLSHEALPPTMRDRGWPEVFIELNLPLTDLASAADEWDAQVIAFPPRP